MTTIWALRLPMRSEQNVADDLEGYSMDENSESVFEEESEFEKEEDDFDFSDISDDE